ncbi:MAG: hypothetical protein GY852_11750, partial [bacterium]|nr:hypothetical protein [bacterium]
MSFQTSHKLLLNAILLLGIAVLGCSVNDGDTYDTAKELESMELDKSNEAGPSGIENSAGDLKGNIRTGPPLDVFDPALKLLDHVPNEVLEAAEEGLSEWIARTSGPDTTRTETGLNLEALKLGIPYEE